MNFGRLRLTSKKNVSAQSSDFLYLTNSLYDARRYEMMKLRLLNAGHSAISYASYLMQHRFVDAAMDPKQSPWQDGVALASVTGQSPENTFTVSNPVRAFCAALFEETTPTVPKVPGVDIELYKVDLLKRFSNP